MVCRVDTGLAVLTLTYSRLRLFTQVKAASERAIEINPNYIFCLEHYRSDLLGRMKYQKNIWIFQECNKIAGD